VRLFSWSTPFEMRRIALTMEQVDEEQPPPNPAKTTDSRFADYRRKYGDESWELDALNPAYLTELVTMHVDDEIDARKWRAREEEIADIKTRIREVARSF
jgi:hypothetical protein